MREANCERLGEDESLVVGRFFRLSSGGSGGSINQAFSPQSAALFICCFFLNWVSRYEKSRQYKQLHPQKKRNRKKKEKEKEKASRVERVTAVR